MKINQNHWNRRKKLENERTYKKTTDGDGDGDGGDGDGDADGDDDGSQHWQPALAASIGSQHWPASIGITKIIEIAGKKLETARTYKTNTDGDGDGGDGDGDADGDDDGSQHWQPALAASICSQHWPASIGITKIVEIAEKN